MRLGSSSGSMSVHAIARVTICSRRVQRVERRVGGRSSVPPRCPRASPGTRRRRLSRWKPHERQPRKRRLGRVAVVADLDDQRAAGIEEARRLLDQRAHGIEAVVAAGERERGSCRYSAGSASIAIGVDVRRVADDEVVALLGQVREEVGADQVDARRRARSRLTLRCATASASEERSTASTSASG